jgi:short subunit fatty acids transporter
MDDMKMRFVELINQMLSNGLWKLILFSLLMIIIWEAKNILAYIRLKKKDKKSKQALLLNILKRLWYVIGGALIIYLAYFMVNSIADILTVPNSLPVNNTSIEVKDFWSLMKYQSQMAGAVGVFGFILTGATLMLSAGSRWLVNTAKVLCTLTVLYLIFSLVLAYV